MYDKDNRGSALFIFTLHITQGIIRFDSILTLSKRGLASKTELNTIMPRMLYALTNIK